MRHLVVLFAALLEVVTSAIQFPEDALFSPNGEFVALYDRPTNIDVLAKNKKLWTANLRGRIDMAVLSADGSTVAVLTEGRRTGLCSVSLYMSNIVRTIDESAFETYFQRAA